MTPVSTSPSEYVPFTVAIVCLPAESLALGAKALPAILTLPGVIQGGRGSMSALAVASTTSCTRGQGGLDALAVTRVLLPADASRATLE